MNKPCKHTEQVSAWLDDQLPPDEARELVDHLSVCAACREERESLEQLSRMFSEFRELVPCGPELVQEGQFEGFGYSASSGARKAFSLLALLVIGIGILFSLAPDLSEGELRFERYLERSLDADVLEMTSLVEEEISRDQVVGLLILSSH
jgi:predicted anti-sigma-YlaC factor YlaD